MKKLTLLLLLVLPACATQEQLADSRARALSRAEDVCQGRGLTPDSLGYRQCLQSVGASHGYTLASDGQLAFVVPDPNAGPGRVGGGTFTMATYVPPVNAYR